MKYDEGLKDVLVFTIVFAENNYVIFGCNDFKVKILEIVYTIDANQKERAHVNNKIVLDEG